MGYAITVSVGGSIVIWITIFSNLNHGAVFLLVLPALAVSYFADRYADLLRNRSGLELATP